MRACVRALPTMTRAETTSHSDFTGRRRGRWKTKKKQKPGENRASRFSVISVTITRRSFVCFLLCVLHVELLLLYKSFCRVIVRRPSSWRVCVCDVCTTELSSRRTRENIKTTVLQCVCVLRTTSDRVARATDDYHSTRRPLTRRRPSAPSAPPVSSGVGILVLQQLYNYI